MRRSEKLILIKDEAAAIMEVLDAILEAQGYERLAARAISEDFSPLLYEEGGPLAFVLSPPRNEWVACFTSLALQAEWDLAEALARGLEQPVVYALFDAERDIYLYRYFEHGELREEALPEAPGTQPLDEAALLAILERHGIAEELVDDRVEGFGQEHLVLGYNAHRRDGGM